MIILKNKILIVFLLIGLIGMICLTFFRKQKYSISIFQTIISMIFLTITGVMGVFLLYFIENGVFGGQSFFGAVLFTPLLMFPTILILRIPYNKLLSICAPAECLMLAIMKIRCVVEGCCGGSDFYNSICPIPLQLVEVLVALLVMVILVALENKKENRNCLYAWYMVIYGAFRFVINSFRAGLTPFVILPAGHFWAVVSIIIGIVNLIICKKYMKMEN